MKCRNCSLCCYLLHMSALSKVSAHQSIRAHVFLTFKYTGGPNWYSKILFLFSSRGVCKSSFHPTLSFLLQSCQKHSDAIASFHSKTLQILPISPDQRNFY